LFRPIVAWADKFRLDNTVSVDAPRSVVLDFLRRTRLTQRLARLPAVLWEMSVRLLPAVPLHKPPQRAPSVWGDRVFVVSMVLFTLGLIVALFLVLPRDFGWLQVGHVMLLGAFTALKVFVLVAISALIWVPVGIWVGLRPRWAAVAQPVAQFLAAFPANLLFPLVVVAIVHWNLNVNVFTAPLMILGSQWYILFSVIGAASALPSDLREAGRNLGLRGWLLWRKLYLPAVFPGFVTGGLTASGGAWNASIVAEVVSWGSHTLIATGLGAYITEATQQGQTLKVGLGVGVMALYVIAINRLVWHRLYKIAATRVRLD
jgi:NitT/TauT family transport system permease protein